MANPKKEMEEFSDERKHVSLEGGRGTGEERSKPRRGGHSAWVSHGGDTSQLVSTSSRRFRQKSVQFMWK